MPARRWIVPGLVSLLTACSAPPALQANWYIVNRDLPPLPLEVSPPAKPASESEVARPSSAASANEGREAGLTYVELLKRTQMVVAILNRGAETTLRRVSVNEALVPPLHTRLAADMKERITGVKEHQPPPISEVPLLPEPLLLPAGGLHVLDVSPLAFSEVPDSALPNRTRLRCLIPLWLEVEYGKQTSKTLPQTVLLKLPSPMPSALPEGWDHCGSLLKIAPPAVKAPETPASAASAASDATSPP